MTIIVDSAGGREVHGRLQPGCGRRDMPKDRSRQRVRDLGVDHAQYVFASVDGDIIRELARRDSRKGCVPMPPRKRAIHHIWPDFLIKRLTVRSISTVKADAAHASFA